MSSTRTISLLIALAFLPLAGLVTAQANDVVVCDECADGTRGTAVTVDGEESFCSETGVIDECQSGEPGTSVRIDGEEVACQEGSFASLTVSFHEGGDGNGPGSSCAG